MEGYHNRAITEAQMRSAEWWIRDAARRHGIPLDRDHVLRHADVDSEQRANCPGGYFAPLMARLLAALPDGAPPAGAGRYGTVVRFERPVLATITVDALNARQWGDLDAPVLETWPHGRRFYADGFVIGDSVPDEKGAEARWYIASGRGLRLWAGGTDRAGLPVAR